MVVFIALLALLEFIVSDRFVRPTGTTGFVAIGGLATLPSSTLPKVTYFSPMLGYLLYGKV